MRYAIDSRKLQKELGWEPSLQFEEGIEETVKWYLENQEWIMLLLGSIRSIMIICIKIDNVFFSKTYPSFLTVKEGCSKIIPSFFTIKEGSTSHPGPLSSGAREETALLGARNRFALRMADHQRSRQIVCRLAHQRRRQVIRQIVCRLAHSMFLSRLCRYNGCRSTMTR